MEHEAAALALYKELAEGDRRAIGDA